MLGCPKLCDGSVLVNEYYTYGLQIEEVEHNATSTGFPSGSDYSSSLPRSSSNTSTVLPRRT